MSEHPFLKATSLFKRFGKVTALYNASFEIQKGEVLTLLGPSGCGKTTTLRIIAGFERPDSGQVEIEGSCVVSLQKGIFLPPEKREMGMVFQSYAIWPHMNVFENVAYPLRLRRTRGSAIRGKVAEVLELVGLSGFEERPAMLLSGGEQQRVALARALVYSPKILLLDEPLSNLDAKLREQMRVELKALQRRLAITVIFVTHDQIEAMTLSDHLVVMRRGRIEQMGRPRDIYEQPETTFVQEFIGRVIWLEGRAEREERDGLIVHLSGNGPTRILCAQCHGELKTGDRVVVAVRPEEVTLHKEHQDGAANLLPCEVESAIFLGDRFECHLRHGELSFALTTSRSGDLTPGQKVSLRLSPESIHVWRKT